ncbi:MAG: Peptidase S11 D-alanyl-D-alanine carboxypeptidase 1 [Parcubacteria group bacterium GW2011_GWA2_47_7]|nr:MAG: Peptidase S11 D-alanyl-D-alanine carboxypeptidase 1 [Parcubacteria group bacterium GW2011_GWA2_47_7]
MNTAQKIQLFLVVTILGFLTGPRVIIALAKLTPDDTLSSPNAAQVATAGTQVNTTPEIVEPPVRAASPFAALTLRGKSIYVWDITDHKKLFSRNEFAELPLASVTKIMMAVVAKELLPANTKITIRSIDILEEGDSGLLAGETWDFDKLLNFTLIASSNDGASAIAGVAGAILPNASSSDPFLNKKLFIEKMNDKARDIGLVNTFFRNESGLDIESLTAGAYGSSRDMAMLFEYVLRKHPELFSPTTYAKIDLKSENNIVHHVTNTNQGVASTNGIIGSKTGFTDLAGGNLVVVVDIGIQHPVVIVVLGSTYEGRFSDVEQLIDATVEKITGKTLNL